MKKILFLIICFFCFISVNATSIETIDMDIVLDVSGTATVTETWKANVSDGTEGYHPYFNIGKSTISVVSASMDGEEYTIVDNWNENASLKDKAYKAGVYKYNSKETDVVFGITSYGSHTYKIVYKITNFVSNLNDSDMIYWQLFPYDFSAQPDNVTIKVSGPENYPDTLDVWGFGMYGAPCYVKDGAIYLTSDGHISSGEYLVLLAKFEKGTFESNSRIEQDFDHYLNMAEEGAEKYTDNDAKESIWDKLEVIFLILFYGVIFGGSIIASLIGYRNKKYGYKDNKTINKKEVPAFREIPCNKDIYYANALIKLNNSKYDYSSIDGIGPKDANILGAIILKWVKEDKIRFINEEKGVFNKNTSSIDLTKDQEFDRTEERQLFDLMRAASGDGILETKELEKWAKKNYSKYLNLFSIISSSEITRLKGEGHIYKRTTKEECKYKNVMDDTIYKDSTELFGLKKFLEEFSLINEKEVIEVKLWDQYLMFAHLFGIADKVAKQLKNLYPEVIKDLEEKGIDIGTIHYINTLSSSSVKAASAAKAAAEAYSSGGGGFSSGGGGGGSFGGGGGGGGFR